MLYCSMTLLNTIVRLSSKSTLRFQAAHYQAQFGQAINTSSVTPMSQEVNVMRGNNYKNANTNFLSGTSNSTMLQGKGGVSLHFGFKLLII